MRAPNSAATSVRLAATTPPPSEGLERRPGRQRSRLMGVLAALGCGTALSCGAASQGGAQAPQPVVAATEAAEAVRRAAMPVAAQEPEDLVLVACVPAAGTALEAMGRLGRQPSLRARAEALMTRQLPAELVAAVDINLPLLAAGALDPTARELPKLLAGFSFGLRAQTKLVDLSVVESTQVDADTRAFETSDGLSCWFRSDAAARAPRLACAESQQALRALGDYLTHGGPIVEASRKSAYIEAFAQPLWKRFGDRARALNQLIPVALGGLYSGDDDFDSALMDGARGLFHQLLLTAADLSHIKISTELLEPVGRLDAHAQVAFQQQGSWLAQSIASSSATMSPAPELFWALPIDALAASYSAKGEPALAEEGWRVAGLLLGQGSAQLGARSTTALRARQALESLSGLRGPTVDAWLPGGEWGSAEARARDVMLVGAEDPDGLLVGLLSAVVELLSDPGLREATLADDIPLGDRLPEYIQRPALPGLPQSVVYEVVRPPGLDGALGDLPFAGQSALAMRYLVALRSGTRSWLASGSDPQQLAARLSTVSRGRPGEQLSARPGLEPLRQRAATTAGFLELAFLLPAELLASRGLRLADLPHKAAGLSFVFGQASASGPTFDVKLETPREAVEDLAAILLRPSPVSMQDIAAPAERSEARALR